MTDTEREDYAHALENIAERMENELRALRVVISSLRKEPHEHDTSQ